MTRGELWGATWRISIIAIGIAVVWSGVSVLFGGA
jgi:hypothetical protein